MDSSPPAVGGLAVEALDLLIDAVATVGPDAWDQPSNLDGWTVRDLVGHATGSAAKIVALVEGGELWQGPSQPADWITDDPVAELRALADRLSRALPDADFDAVRPSPAGEVAVHQALGFPVADLAMHS